jgi:hypothetical protein
VRVAEDWRRDKWGGVGPNYVSETNPVVRISSSIINFLVLALGEPVR